MLEIFNFGKEKNLSEEEKSEKRALFLSNSENDFAKANEIADRIEDPERKEKVLQMISSREVKKKETPEPKNNLGRGDYTDLTLSDMKDAIQKEDFDDAKSIASQLAENDENYGAKAFLEIAEAELEKGKNPAKSISQARKIATVSEDPWHKITILSDIMRLEGYQGKYDDALQTAQEIKKLEKNDAEYDARLFFSIASAEKDIGNSK